jgi:hypothetical protein
MLATASSSCAVGPSCQLFSSGHGRGARQAPVPGDLSGSGLRRSSPDSEAWRENVAGQFWIAPKAIGARYSLRKIVAIRKFEPDERAHQDMHYTACGFGSSGRTRTYSPLVNSGRLLGARMSPRFRTVTRGCRRYCAVRAVEREEVQGGD